MGVGCGMDVSHHLLREHLQVHALPLCRLQPSDKPRLQDLLCMPRDCFCAQAGLKKSQLNVLSSCEETDAMEDLSPLRSGSRKKKVSSLPNLLAEDDCSLLDSACVYPLDSKQASSCAAAVSAEGFIDQLGRLLTPGSHAILVMRELSLEVSPLLYGLCVCAAPCGGEAQGGPAHRLLWRPRLARPHPGRTPPHQAPHRQPRVGAPRARAPPGRHRRDVLQVRQAVHAPPCR